METLETGYHLEMASVRPWGSWITAAVLSVLTLSVFAFSRDTGPESTVRQYLRACAINDFNTASLYLTSGGEKGTSLSRDLGNIVRLSRNIRLGGVSKNGREAYVDVVFELPGGITAVRFVVIKSSLRWQVDVDRTLELAQRMRRFE